LKTTIEEKKMILKNKAEDVETSDIFSLSALTTAKYRPVSSVEDQAGASDLWRCVELLADSGAVDNVGDPREFPEYRVKPSAGSLAGLSYVAANKGKIANEGEQHLRLCSMDGSFGFKMKIQSAAVSRPILSVARLVENDNDVSFSKTGGTIKNRTTGWIVRFEHKHGVYVLRAWLRTGPDPGAQATADSKADFTRQA
jgi:hypothetical protein